MCLVDAIGFAAASLTTSPSSRRWSRTIPRADTIGISLSTYLLFYARVTLSLAYSILRADLLILANTVALASPAGDLTLKLRTRW